VLLQWSARQSKGIKKHGKEDGEGEVGCVCHLEEVAPDGWSMKARLQARGEADGGGRPRVVCRRRLAARCPPSRA
jgi:hypothetical protein